MPIDPERLRSALDSTWPAARYHRAGPFTLREGQGGGKRVSAATADAPWQPDDIASAEAGMAALGQPALFLLRDGDDALDAALGQRGYRIVDPVLVYAARTSGLGLPPDPMTAFTHWPPLAIVTDLWAEAGIGPGRVKVMDRAPGPKVAILGRHRDRTAGGAFVACDGAIAVLHALEIVPARRRQGLAAAMLRRAARWASDQGAEWLALAVTEANAPARSLYAFLGMQVVGKYQYRTK